MTPYDIDERFLNRLIEKGYTPVSPQLPEAEAFRRLVLTINEDPDNEYRIVTDRKLLPSGVYVVVRV